MKKERFISGIYNYCDYWCDRCAFTRRCRNFSMDREMEEEEGAGKVGDDATQATFWTRLAEQVREARMLADTTDHEWADAVAIEDDSAAENEWLEQHEARSRAMREHPLSVLATAYMMRVGAWLKSADRDLKAVAQDLLAAAGSKFSQDDHEEQALEIGEMIEVVAWYHTLIGPKLTRCLHSLLEKDDGGEMLAEIRLHDANGTGKVVLVAVERSIAAWLRLRKIVPQREDEILEMLSMLSRLQRGIHTTLPGAKSFLRPGFDAPPAEDDE